MMGDLEFSLLLSFKFCQLGIFCLLTFVTQRQIHNGSMHSDQLSGLVVKVFANYLAKRMLKEKSTLFVVGLMPIIDNILVDVETIHHIT